MSDVPTKTSGYMPQVEPLTNKDHFDDWSKKVMVWFVYNDLDGLLDGTWTAPEPVAGNISARQRDAYTKDLAKFRLSNKKGMAAIRHSCGLGPDLEIEEMTTAQEMWKHLALNYTPAGGRVFDRVVQEIYTCRSTTKSVQEYASKLRRLAAEAARIDDSCKLTDRWLAVIFMQGLGQGFDGFLTSFKTQHDLIKDVTFDLVVRKAVEFEATPAQSTLPTSTQDGLIMVAVKAGSRYCGHCHKTNHDEGNCWEKKPHLKRLFESQNSGSNKRRRGGASKKEEGQVNLSTASTVVEEINGAGFLLPSQTPLSSTEWVLDSGADCHISNDRSLFTSLDTNIRGSVGSWMKGNNGTIQGKGTVTLTFTTSMGPRQTVLQNVLYAPNSTVNLISLSVLHDKGYSQRWSKDNQSFYIVKNDQIWAQGNRKGGLFCFEIHPTSESSQPRAMLSHSLPSLPIAQLWHQRLAHLGWQNIQRLATMADGIDLTDKLDGPICNACVLGKQKSHSHNNPIRPATRYLELIHTDLCGPFNPSINGDKYFVTFLDDYTKYIRLLPLKSKDEYLSAFKKFKAVVEKGNHKLHRVRGDAELHQSIEAQDFFNEEGLEFEPTSPYSPEQNGAAERLNRTLVERVRTVRVAKNLSFELWGELLKSVVEISNRCPVTNRDKTPYELAKGARPDISHLRILGCTAYMLRPEAHIRADQKKGLDPTGPIKLLDRSKPMVLVGYDGTCLYKLWDPKERRIHRSSDVDFDEVPSLKRPADYLFSEQPAKRHQAESVGDHDSTGNQYIPSEEDNLQSQPTMGDTIVVGGGALLTTNTAQTLPEPEEISATALLAALIDANQKVPKSYRQAVNSIEGPEWHDASLREYNSFIKTTTWTLVRRPKHRAVIRGCWVYRRKIGKHGQILKYKARWCIRGDLQKEGIDYQEVFSSVVKSMTYKLLFNRAAVEDLEIEQMDVKTAFLNSPIDTEVYMEQPEGFEDPNHPADEWVCKLNRAIYGLKQAPRAWYITLAKFLISQGLKPCDADRSVFYNKDVIVAVYVDDLLLFGFDKRKIQNLKKALSERFEMEDLGACSWYLGIDIQRDRPQRIITLNQKTYIEKILQRFDLFNCTPAETPMVVGCKLSKAPEDYICTALFRERYQEAIGSLMYAMLCTRPDIAYAVKTLSRFASNPMKTHWTAVTRVFKYLKGTINATLVYKPCKDPILSGFTDAAYKDCPDTSKSSSGYIFNAGSGAISWSSKLQSKIATSTTHSEFLGEFNAVKEALFLRQVSEELWPVILPLEGVSIHIKADNNGAIGLSAGTTPHSHTKHFDKMEVNYVQEQVQLQRVLLQKIPTEDNIADIFTKPLPESKFRRFRQGLGIET